MPLYFIIVLFLFLPLFSQAEIPKIENQMSQEEFHLTGLEKLTPDELQHLNNWLLYHPSPSFLGKERSVDWEHLDWVFESRHLKIPLHEKTYEIGALAIIHNEAPFLKEWLEYHKLQGVEHFWIYNHLSTDEYLKVLEPYIKSGEVELIDWTLEAFPSCQITAYDDGIKKATNRVKWLIVIDIDEFLVPHADKNLAAYLKRWNHADQILINWQLFGTSNIQTLPAGNLSTEVFIYKFPVHFRHTWNGNHYVKSIVRPEKVKFPVYCAHCFDLQPESITINGSGYKMKPFPTTSEIYTDQIQLNHYWFRSIDFFYDEKVRRRALVGEAYSQELIEWLLKMGNSEKDTAIHRFLPSLKIALNMP